MKKHVQSFNAKGDNGRTYSVDVYEEIVPAGTLDDPARTEAGPMELRTADGRAVSRLGKGKYEIVGTGVKLTTEDPEAP